MSENTERRRFKRIAFDAPTRLVQGEREWSVELLDISFKGLLIETPDGWDADPKHPFEAAISLGGDVVVYMTVELMHQERHHLGFLCVSIELDSITELRRIVELNTENRTELEREFHELIEV